MGSNPRGNFIKPLGTLSIKNKYKNKVPGKSCKLREISMCELYPEKHNIPTWGWKNYRLWTQSISPSVFVCAIN